MATVTWGSFVWGDGTVWGGEAAPLPQLGGVLVTLGSDPIGVAVTPGTDDIAAAVTPGTDPIAIHATPGTDPIGVAVTQGEL